MSTDTPAASPSLEEIDAALANSRNEDIPLRVLQEVLRLHALWLQGDPEGRRADFRQVTLEGANLAGVDLRHAILRYANLSDSDFEGANLRDADFTGADLRDADFTHAQLCDADLTHTMLHRALFTAAALHGARLPKAPVVPDLDYRILTLIERGSGSLNMDAWHTCQTTHCLAGWAIHLAGVSGYDLERDLGPSVAGTLIFQASCGYVPDFFARNEEALQDLRERVEEEHDHD